MSGILQGVRLLVVEDEFFAAMELQRMIEEMGGVVLGPFAQLDKAEKVSSEERFDGAVLDVKLNGDTTISLAGRLVEQGVPVILSTGYATEMLPANLSAVPRLPKPFSETLFRQLAEQKFALARA